MLSCVHVVKSARPECTGICQIIASLEKHTKSQGYEVSVLFLDDGPLKAQMVDLGIPASVIPWKGTRSDVRGAAGVLRWLRKRPIEILHLHWGSRMVRAIGRLGGAGVIIQHAHGRVDEVNGSIPQRIRFPWVNAVVACSEVIAGCVEGHQPEVIYAGVETNPTPSSLMTHVGPLRIGTLSRLTLVKNLEMLISAIARLKSLGIDIRADIAGSGPSESELHSAVDRLALADRVHFLGWREDISDLLSSWDLLVMPSLDEGFPIAVLQAMAEARPVVASKVGGLTELVVDGLTGRLIPSGDLDALVQCIAELANNRRALAEMGKEGWERVRLEFSPEHMARQMTRLYDNLLNRG